MKKYLAGFLIGVIVTVGMTAFADEIKSIVAEKATCQKGDMYDSKRNNQRA